MKMVAHVPLYWNQALVEEGNNEISVIGIGVIIHTKQCTVQITRLG